MSMNHDADSNLKVLFYSRSRRERLDRRHETSTDRTMRQLPLTPPQPSSDRVSVRRAACTRESLDEPGCGDGTSGGVSSSSPLPARDARSSTGLVKLTSHAVDGDASSSTEPSVIGGQLWNRIEEPESLATPRAPSLACHFNRPYKRRSPVLAHRLPAVAAV